MCLRLTDDAVEDLPQCLKAFQNEDVTLATLLRSQSVQLISLQIVPDAEHVDV